MTPETARPQAVLCAECGVGLEYRMERYGAGTGWFLACPNDTRHWGRVTPAAPLDARAEPARRVA